MVSEINVKKSKFLITGGSGSLGRNIIKRLLKKGAKNIISVSRDEQLIKDAQTDLGSSIVRFMLGDINDPQLIQRLMKEADLVFHTAALKHVSLAEANPREFYRVNIVGLLNLLDKSESTKRFIHVSSDKAIGVVNCYGATKLLGEYLVRETNSLYRGKNKYLIVRCPNFLGSRGSVLDLWRQQLNKENIIRITDPEMTRYFVTLENAARFITDLALSSKPDTQKIYYPFSYTQKFLLGDLAQSFIEVFGNKNTRIEILGAQPGEKRHEDYIHDVALTSKKNLSKLLKSLE